MESIKTYNHLKIMDLDSIYRVESTENGKINLIKNQYNSLKLTKYR